MSIPIRRAPLALLLGAFGAASYGALLLLVTLAQPRGDEARHAYRPADFPALFARDTALDGLATLSTANTFVVPGPPLDKDLWPCSQCHDNKDLKSNPEPRPHLRDPHESHSVAHGGLWCLSCHDALDKDRLHLASGQLADLTDPLPLCAQCHGAKAREWESGVHGLRTGYWNGKKRVFLCTVCHDPHHPHVKAIEALPPPVRPSFAHDGASQEKR